MKGTSRNQRRDDETKDEFKDRLGNAKEAFFEGDEEEKPQLDEDVLADKLADRIIERIEEPLSASIADKVSEDVLIKVEDKIDQPLPTFEQLEQNLRQLLLTEAYTDAVKNGREKLGVKLLDESLKLPETSQ